MSSEYANIPQEFVRIHSGDTFVDVDPAAFSVALAAQVKGKDKEDYLESCKLALIEAAPEVSAWPSCKIGSAAIRLANWIAKQGNA